MMKRPPAAIRLFLFLICVVPLFWSACSNSEPRIVFGSMELVYYPGERAPVERFSFFIIVEDDDGTDNLDQLRLYFDRDGLEWILNSDDWILHEEDGKTWIGSRAVAMTGDGVLPRGQYRAVLINKGGKKTERLFTFDAPPYPPYPYPVFSIEGDKYLIDSAYPNNFFIVYDQQGNVLRTIPVTLTHGDVSDLRLPNSARLLALWAQDSEYHTSVLTEALPLR